MRARRAPAVSGSTHVAPDGALFMPPARAANTESEEA
jgi:hypothetical protein